MDSDLAARELGPPTASGRVPVLLGHRVGWAHRGPGRVGGWVYCDAGSEAPCRAVRRRPCDVEWFFGGVDAAGCYCGADGEPAASAPIVVLVGDLGQMSWFYAPEPALGVGHAAGRLLSVGHE